MSRSCFLTASLMWHSYVSHESRHFLKENLLITSLIHLNVSSSLIHPFHDAIEHWPLNSSRRAFDSRFAAAKTMKGFIFAPSSLAAKHALIPTLTFSCLVFFHGNILFTYNFNSCICYHVCPNWSFIHGYYK